MCAALALTLALALEGEGGVDMLLRSLEVHVCRRRCGGCGIGRGRWSRDGRVHFTD